MVAIILADTGEEQGPAVHQQRVRNRLPQGMSWEWFAGFFDGEGSIAISRVRNRSVRLSIGQVDPTPLNAIRIFLFDRGIEGRMYFIPHSGNRQDSWVFGINAKEPVHYTLKHLLPFLIVKERKAQEALQFLAGMRAGGRRRTLTIEERVEITMQYHQGRSIKSLMAEYHMGLKATSDAIVGVKRGNNRGYKVCPKCGFNKKWSKGRDGQPTLCKGCETERRRSLAHPPAAARPSRLRQPPAV